MSNDLISRSAVKRLIESKCVDGCWGTDDITLIDANELLDDVFDLPVAYDVDRVVEQIEGIMHDESIRFCDQAVSYAVNIVKSGGQKTK